MRILIVEDEKRFALLVSDELKTFGHQVAIATSGNQALKLIDEDPFDIVVTDIRMSPVDGVQLLKEIKDNYPETEVIMMTAYASVDTAVEALRYGAFDYLIKPFNLEELRLTIDQITEKMKHVRERDGIKREVASEEELIYASDAMDEVVHLAEEVAQTDTPVLITGESGTGKELVARRIHNSSKRSANPFLAIHCAAIPETLLESELFGYEKGAFTGATKCKPGKFEIADKGSVFLDEVAEIPPAIQVKLLRVLQEKMVSKLGSTEQTKVDVRIISATNKDLEKLISEGKFRDDLYYRLNVFPIHVPPLRERSEDINILVKHILNQLSFDYGIDDTAISELLTYPWPGNVRELENILERATIIAKGRIRREHLKLKSKAKGIKGLAETEKGMIIEALKKADGNKAKAARILGITRRTLYSRMKKYGIR